MKLSPFFIALALSSAPVFADDISDTIQSALEAYNDGDNAYALEELAYATQLLKAMKADELSAFLPPAPDGWTKEIDEDIATGMAALGGGSGAAAEYSSGNDYVTITLMADSPMVASMGAMIANPILTGGKLVRIGRNKFVDNDGELLGMINNRVMVQASGAEPEIMMPFLESIDFKALGNFGN